METILWTQNEDPNDKETFIINGVVSAYEGKPEQDKAFALLSDARKRKSWFSLNRDVNPKKRFPNRDSSENLQCYHSVKGTMIQACYRETDKAGRKMPYMFFTASSDWKTIIRQLNENSEKIGRTCHAKDLEDLKRWSEQKRTLQLVGIIGGIILAIIIIVVILKWKQSN